MRSLAQPRVLMTSGVAALITGILCYPRLAGWSERAEPVRFLSLLLLWSAFVLWAFVFAWHFQYTGKPVLALRPNPRVWSLATGYGLAAGIWMHLFVDPQLRLITPGDYPATAHAWAAMTSFAVAFDPLFLCFAPFAFFIRLARKQTPATVLTVLFGVFILFLKLRSSMGLPSIGVLVGMLALRVGAGFVAVYFYLQGGAWVVWWLVLLTQLRHLADLPAKG